MEGHLTLVIGFTDTSMIGFPVLGLIGKICNNDPFRLRSPRLPRGHGAAFWKTFGARSREALKVPARRLDTGAEPTSERRYVRDLAGDLAHGDSWALMYALMTFWDTRSVVGTCPHKHRRRIDQCLRKASQPRRTEKKAKVSNKDQAYPPVTWATTT